METVDVFRETKLLLDNDWSWIKTYFAVDHKQRSVDPEDESACQWCLVGALIKVTKRQSGLYQEAIDVLEEIEDIAVLSEDDIGDSEPIVYYNDAVAENYEDIVRLLDKGIEAVS